MLIEGNCTVDKEVRRLTRLSDKALYKHAKRLLSEEKMIGVSIAHLTVYDDVYVKIATNVGVLLADKDMMTAKKLDDSSMEAAILRDYIDFKDSLGAYVYRQYRDFHRVRGRASKLPIYEDIDDFQKRAWQFAVAKMCDKIYCKAIQIHTKSKGLALELVNPERI
jgi:hypothetical protein